MDGKLKKTGNDYKLYAQDDSCIATSWHSPYQRLSKKNCDAIVNGYDLDELADEYFMQEYAWCKSNTLPYTDEGVRITKKDFMSGAKTIIEILGDKRFSKNKLLVDFVYFLNDRHFNKYMVDTDEVDLYLESLQQTEWDVEIEMWFHGTRHKKGEWIPKLDADGCLILKKK